MDSPQIPFVWRQFGISKHKSFTTVSDHFQRAVCGLNAKHFPVGCEPQETAQMVREELWNKTRV
jgi:hypothetical protein